MTAYTKFVTVPSLERFEARGGADETIDRVVEDGSYDGGL
jgi:hypothetical protein